MSYLLRCWIVLFDMVSFQIYLQALFHVNLVDAHSAPITKNDILFEFAKSISAMIGDRYYMVICLIFLTRFCLQVPTSGEKKQQQRVYMWCFFQGESHGSFIKYMFLSNYMFYKRVDLMAPRLTQHFIYLRLIMIKMNSCGLIGKR